MAVNKPACLFVLVSVSALSCREKAVTVARPAGAPSAAVPEAYVLALNEEVPPPGTKITVDQKFMLENGTRVYIGPGKVERHACTFTGLETGAIDFVSREKVKWLVTASDRHQLLDGMVPDRWPEHSPLFKIPTTFTKTGGRWTAAPDQGSPDEEQEKELKRRAKVVGIPRGFLIYGGTPRRVGEIWTVTGSDMPFTDELKSAAGTLQLTFKGVETHAGRKCARLEGPIDLKGDVEVEKGRMTFALKGDLSILRAIGEQLDLKMDFKGRSTREAGFPDKGG